MPYLPFDRMGRAFVYSDNLTKTSQSQPCIDDLKAFPEEEESPLFETPLPDINGQI